MADPQLQIPSLQMLVNQANQDAPQNPSLVLAPPAPTPPPPEPSYVLRNSGGTNPLLSQEPAVEPHGLDGYLPPRPSANDEEMAGYKRQADEALAAQGGGLDSLQAYIKDMQGKPQGINWTPLAAYIDSQNPKSKMLEAAKAMAPMSPEERDKQLFDLQVKLQGGRAAMSADQLKALGEQIKMRHDNDRDAQQKKYQDQMAQAAMISANNRGGIVDVRRDNQTSQAVDKVVNDKALLQHSMRINGADRILNQMDAAKDGKMVDTAQFLNDINEEYLALLKGNGNGALGHLERTEYTSAKSKMASIMQSINAHPESINSPDILKQLRTGVEEMKGSYNRAYDIRANDLRRTYKHNPDATQQMSDKIEQMRGHFGEQAAPDDDAQAIAWAKAQPAGDARAAKILSHHGVQ